MNRGGIVHPRLLQELPDEYPTTCTIKRNLGTTQTASGQPVPDLQDLPDHVDIPCVVATSFAGTNRSREVRRPGDTITRSTHRIGLQGHFPAITTAMVAVVDGRTHNILAVEHDSQGASTYLETEIVA